MRRGPLGSEGAGGMKVMAWVLIVLLSGVSASVARGQSSDPSDAVFQVEVWSAQKASDGHYHSHGYGTGFFIKPDGTALTASHVVDEAVHDPEHYRLMAIVGHEFFDATVLCASRLPYDPTKPDPNSGVPLSRDVAEIKLSPSTFPFREIALRIGAERFVTAAAHADLLPDFPFLTIGGDPQGHVRVIGFGHISPIPYKWTSEGQVDKSLHEEGTDFFDVRFVSPPQPGNSGSPVLDDQNRVVGLWVWHFMIHRDMGTAQALSAFRNSCP